MAATINFDIYVMVDFKQVREALLNQDESPWTSRFQARALARMVRDLNISTHRGFDESVRNFLNKSICISTQ